MENTSFGLKKLNKNKVKNDKICKVLYYINFIPKKVDFWKNSSKIISQYWQITEPTKKKII